MCGPDLLRTFDEHAKALRSEIEGFMLALHEHEAGDLFPAYWPAGPRQARAREIADMALGAVAANTPLPDYVILCASLYAQRRPAPLTDAAALLAFAHTVAGFVAAGESDLADAERMAGLVRTARRLCARFVAEAPP